MKEKINKVTSLMVECGFIRFYEAFASFLINMRKQKLSKAEDDDDFRVLAIDDLKGPLMFCMYLMGFAWFVFLLEIIIRKLKMRR